MPHRLRSFGFAAYCHINGAGPHQCEQCAENRMTDDASCVDTGMMVVCAECAAAIDEECELSSDIDAEAR